MKDPADPRNVTILVSRLVDAVNARGLSAEPFGAAMAWVANRAAEPANGSPGLRQAVLCRASGDGRLGWWWVWTAPDGSPEYEWICPADEITMAADAIARVLALRPVDERAAR
jgi:hypothetical protein